MYICFVFIYIHKCVYSYVYFFNTFAYIYTVSTQYYLQSDLRIMESGEAEAYGQEISLHFMLPLLLEFLT